MSLLELPAELILAVADVCKPYDHFCLALSCHELHEVLNETISKHQKLWRYWNTIKTANSKRPFHGLLLQLARKPHITQYIECFKCGSNYNVLGAYSKSEMGELMSYLERFCTSWKTVFDEFNVQNWRQNYETGLESLSMRHLSSFLVYMTPNLRRLECVGEHQEDLLILLVNVARTSSTSTGIPLQHLKSIQIQLHEGYSEGGLNADWLIASMHLPCLDTFAASRMSGIVEHFEMDDIPDSNIKSVVLQASTFDPDVLIRILGKLTKLKSFAYESGEDCLVYEGGSFSAKKITTALVEYAGHSLENLTMVGKDESLEIYLDVGDELPYVSLKGFKRLKTLRCSTYLLTSDPKFPQPTEPLASNYVMRAQSSEEYRQAVKLGVFQENDFLQPTPETLRCLAFATRLPASLKALHLESYPCHTPLAYYALSEFVQKADGLLPRLKQLYLSDWGLQYLEEKGLLRSIAKTSLKYRKLPDPFRIGHTTRCNDDSESEFEDSSEEEE